MVSQREETRRSVWTPVPIAFYPEESSAVGRAYYVYLIGGGGNGGWLAPLVVRLIWRLEEKWRALQAAHPDGSFHRTIKLIFVDPDIVERKNVESRQNFISCDVGYSKAELLALRYSLAFPNVQIEVRKQLFDPSWVRDHHFGMVILIDCTDNAQARIAINQALSLNVGAPWPRVWWLFAGNGYSSGQVHVGNTASVERLAGALAGRVCSRLPSPALIEPGILIPKPDEVAVGGLGLSCDDLVLADAQSPTINPHMAAWLHTYLDGLFFGGLTFCGTYLSLETGSASSIETSAQAWGERLKVDPVKFLELPVGEDETRETADGEALLEEEDEEIEEEATETEGED